MTVVRRTQLGAAAAAVALSGVLFAPAAVAATPAPSTVFHLQYDNEDDGFVLSLESSVVAQGSDLTAFIDGDIPGRVYSGTVFSSPIFLGTVTADSAGDASFTFSTADLDVGPHRVEVTDTVTEEVATAFFDVVATQGRVVPVGAPNDFGTGGNQVPQSQSGGDFRAANEAGPGQLAFTGTSAVVPLTTLGAILVAGGTVALVAARRRGSVTD